MSNLYVGADQTYTTIMDAVSAAQEGDVIVVSSDVTETFDDATITGEIVAAEGKKVTVAGVAEDVVNLNDAKIGDNVTLDVKGIYLSGTNNIAGDVKSQQTFYQYDGQLTITGNAEVYNVFNRYNGADEGIFIVGNAAEGEGKTAAAQLKAKGYLSTYSGIFSVKNSAVEVGYVNFGHTADGNYSAGKIILDNALFKTVGGPNTQPGQMLVTCGASLEASNDSVLDLRGPKDFGYLSMEAGTTFTFTDSAMYLGREGQGGNSLNGTLTLNNSVVNSLGKITNNGTITIDGTSFLTATQLLGNGTITIDVTGATGVKTIVDVNSFADTLAINVINNEDNKISILRGEDGDIILSAADMSTIYVNAAYSGKVGDDLGDGKYFGINAFSDIEAAVEAAKASAGKLVVAEGTEVHYGADAVPVWSKLFFNTDPNEGGENNAYDNVVSADKTFDLDVNGVLKAYQVIMNNANTIVSETGRVLALGESFRIMGGSVTVNGTMGEADPTEVFTGSWGAGTKAGADTQIGCGYFCVNQEAVAEFNDTVIFVSAGWFEVNNATADFDNTYIYLGSGGTYAPVAVNFINGAEVTFADSTMVNDPVFTMNITVGADSTLTLADSKLAATTLANSGSVTVSGESTLNIGSLTGNSITALDGAVIKDSTVKTAGGLETGAMDGDAYLNYALSANGDKAGVVTFAGENVIASLDAAEGDKVVIAGEETAVEFLNDGFKLGNGAEWEIADGASVTGWALSLDSVANGTAYASKMLVDEASMTVSKISSKGTKAGQEIGAGSFDVTFNKAELNLTGTTAIEIQAQDTAAINLAFVDTVIKGANGADTIQRIKNDSANATLTFEGTDVTISQTFRNKGTMNILEGADIVVNSVILSGDHYSANEGILNINGGTLTYNAALVNTGSININGGTLTVDSMTNTGSLNFTFTAAPTIAKDGLLLIDAAKASDYGTVTLNGLDAKYEAIVIGEDLFAFDMSTIYVDAAYSTYAAGAKIADGIFMGINAFASFDELNKSIYSAGDRTVVYTYAGSAAGQKITVANDPDTTGVQYSFNGTGVSFSNGSRTHTITEAGVYTFDFAKGDYNFAIEEFVGNTTVALPDAADVAVNQIVGDQEFTFSVADNTTGTFACSFSGVSGAFRVTIYRGTEEVASKLFNAAGSYSVDDLAAGEYSVVFSAYGKNSAGAQLTADFELTSVAAPVAGDPCSTLDNTSAGSIGADFVAGMTLENWVGTEDKIDWFQIEDVTAGTHTFNFELEGNNLAVVIYDANLKTLSSFTVTDKVADGVDFTRSLKLAADSDLFIKVTGRGADSDYSISIA